MLARLRDLLLDSGYLRVYVLDLGPALRVLDDERRALLAQSRELLFKLGYPRAGGLGQRVGRVGVARGTVGGLGQLAVVLGFEQLPIESRQTLDDRVLARVERENLVALRVVAQT